MKFFYVFPSQRSMKCSFHKKTLLSEPITTEKQLIVIILKHSLINTNTFGCLNRLLDCEKCHSILIVELCLSDQYTGRLCRPVSNFILSCSQKTSSCQKGRKLLTPPRILKLPGKFHVGQHALASDTCPNFFISRICKFVKMLL